MGSQRNFEGVRAASESTIEIDFYYAGARRRERLKLEPTPANLKRAAQHRAAVLSAIDNGTFDYAVTFPKSRFAKNLQKDGPPDQQTIGAYLLAWMERRRPTWKASTYDGYSKIIRGIIIPAIGDETLSGLKRVTIREWVSGMSAGNKTIANVMSVLRAAMQEAFADELIEVNPAAGWTYRKASQPHEDAIDPFSPQEQAAILGALEGQGRNLIQFAFWTGLRTSELVALDWSDVDLVNGAIMIRRAQTDAGRRAEATKTKAGRRTVKLLAPALEAITAQKAFTYLAGNEVFQDPRYRARWVGDQAIRKSLWTPALRRGGVRYRNPYQTRHTYASMMLSAGEHPMWVAQQMGHRDWTMIARVYGRWIPAADQSAGSKAVMLFRNADQKADQTPPTDTIFFDKTRMA